MGSGRSSSLGCEGRLALELFGFAPGDEVDAAEGPEGSGFKLLGRDFDGGDGGSDDDDDGCKRAGSRKGLWDDMVAKVEGTGLSIIKGPSLHRPDGPRPL